MWTRNAPCPHFNRLYCYCVLLSLFFLVLDNCIHRWPPDDWSESREEYAERLRNTPTHLCRLRYFGNDEWGFAFYTYSHEKYELSMYDDGQFTGTPERAFLISAGAYLNE